MTLRFIPTTPTKAQLIAKAASGTKGCVKARQSLSERLHEQLRRELAASSPLATRQASAAMLDRLAGG